MNIPQHGAHLDYVLRQKRWHHVQLSSLADCKANIMLTVSSGVITLSVRYLTGPAIKWVALTLMGYGKNNERSLQDL